jgi:hypothetical protein
MLQVPKTITAAEAFEAIRVNIDGVAEHSETAARTFVQRILGVLGYTRAPRVLNGRVDGSTARLYVFEGTPIGDVVLVGGPSWINRFVKLEALAKQAGPGEIYVLAKVDTTANATAAAKTAERVGASYGRDQARVAAAAARAAAPPRTPPPPRTPSRRAPPLAAPAPAAPPPPMSAADGGPPPDVAKKLDAAISGLTSLLG